MSKYFDGDYRTPRLIETGGRMYPMQSTREIFEYEKAYEIMTAYYTPWDGKLIVQDEACFLIDESVIKVENSITVFRRKFGYFPDKLISDYTVAMLTVETDVSVATSPSTTGGTNSSTSSGTASTGPTTVTIIDTGLSGIGGAIDGRNRDAVDFNQFWETAKTLDLMPIQSIGATARIANSECGISTGILNLDFDGATGYTIGYVEGKTDYTAEFIALGGHATNFTDHYLELKDFPSWSDQSKRDLICTYGIQSGEPMVVNFDVSELKGTYDTPCYIKPFRRFTQEAQAEITQLTSGNSFFVKKPTNTDQISTIEVGKFGLGGYYGAKMSEFRQSGVVVSSDDITDFAMEKLWTPKSLIGGVKTVLPYNTNLTKEILLSAIKNEVGFYFGIQTYDEWINPYYWQFYPSTHSITLNAFNLLESQVQLTVEEVEVDSVDYWKFTYSSIRKGVSELSGLIEYVKSLFNLNEWGLSGGTQGSDVKKSFSRFLSSDPRPDDEIPKFSFFTKTDSVAGVTALPYLLIKEYQEDEVIVDVWNNANSFNETLPADIARCELMLTIYNEQIAGLYQGSTSVITIDNVSSINQRNLWEYMRKTGLTFSKKIDDFSVGDKVRLYGFDVRASGTPRGKSLGTATVLYVNTTNGRISLDWGSEDGQSRYLSEFTAIAKI